MSAATSPAILKAKLEEEIQLRFGIKASVLARTATSWQACIEGNPFHAESLREPSLVMLALSKVRPKPETVETLRAREL